MGIEELPKFVRDHYEVHEWRHATAILKNDYPGEFRDIVDILSRFRLTKEDILNPGGGLSTISQRFNKAFKSKGWVEKSFDTKIVVDGNEMLSPTHKVDCFKNSIAFEIEWSNKDPFYDRDLNNFRLLFDLRTASVGIILTKSDELSEIMKGLGKKIWGKIWNSLPGINGKAGNSGEMR